MLFSSYEFLLIFLPLAWFAYVHVGRRSQDAAIGVLLAFSFFFYAWWSSFFLLLLIGSISFNFVIGSALSRRQGKSGKLRSGLLALGVFVNLFLLAYFKYADFLILSISSLLGWAPVSNGILLPMGISFYTFTQIAFLVDAYRDDVREYRPFHYGLFVTYFPHLIAGPVLHHKEMMPQFSRGNNQVSITPENICLGLGFLSVGLFKKLVVADKLAVFVAPIFDAAHNPSLIEAWFAALAYTFQLYFDFSGYSDMAIGISLMFGIWLPFNFNSPYKASSIAEFWRRWHMTLSRFLREYLYIPLGGGREGKLRMVRNLFITMVLGGVWHGAGWTFVAWGAFHGALLVMNHMWQSLASKLTSPLWRSQGFHFACCSATFFCVVVGWVFFRAVDLNSALSILMGMAGMNGLAVPDQIISRFDWVPSGWIRGGGANFAYPDLVHVFGLLLAVSLAVFYLPNSQQILLGRAEAQQSQLFNTKSFFLRLPAYPRAILTAAVALIAIAHISELSPFLYFQF